MKILFFLILAYCYSAICHANDLDSELIAKYPLGANARDFSNNGNNGTLNNAVAVTDRNGASGKATHFETKNNTYGNLKVPLNINPAKVPQLTIAFWIKFDRLLGSLHVLSMGDENKQRSLSTQLEDGYPVWRLGCGKRGEVCGSRITSDWTFVAVVYDQPNGAVRLIINNEVFSSRTEIRDSKLNPVFGNFPGSIDDIRIYKRILSLSEIEEIYGSEIDVNAKKYAIIERKDFRKEKELKEKNDLDSLRSRIVVAKDLDIYDPEKYGYKIDFLNVGDSLQIIEMKDDRAIVSYKDKKKGSVGYNSLYKYTRYIDESGLKRKVSFLLDEIFDYKKLRSWIIIGTLAVLLVLVFRFFEEIDNLFMWFKKDKTAQASGGKNDAVVKEHKPSVFSKLFPINGFRTWPLYIGVIIAVLILVTMLFDRHEAEWFLNKGISLIPNHYEVPVHWVLWGGTIFVLIMTIILLIESLTIAGPIGGTLRFIFLLFVNFIMLIIAFYLFLLFLIICAVIIGLFLLSSLGSRRRYRYTEY